MNSNRFASLALALAAIGAASCSSTQSSAPAVPVWKAARQKA